MVSSLAPTTGAPTTPTHGHTLTVNKLQAFYARQPVIQPVTMTIPARQITAIIGPSGCGKSTMLRCLNRMHEMIEGAHAEGTVLLDDENIYAPGVDPRLVRRKIGMVFQQPVVLHTRSIYDNIAIGPRLNGIRKRHQLDEIVERHLRAAVLWDEVKDRLNKPGYVLSGGQQQRLSIARTLAVEPDVILFDEPCSALDPIATMKVEELLLKLRETYTLVIVTHNMQQAARIADTTAVIMIDRAEESYIGLLVEYADTEQIFSNPRDRRTQDYIGGRMG